MNNAFSTLILGAGPAAIQLAADIKAAANARIGLYNRPSEKGQRLRHHLAHAPSLSLTGAGKAQRTQGDTQVTIDSYCDDLSLVGGDWHRLILAVPADQYHDVLRQVPWAALPQLRSLILLSPSIGSGLMVQSLLQDAGQSHVGIISLSSYYADTKYQDAAQPYRAYTKAFKQRIYLAGQSPSSDRAELDWLCAVLARHGIDAQRCDSLLAAERFSITNYVHPRWRWPIPRYRRSFSRRRRYSTCIRPTPKALSAPRRSPTCWRSRRITGSCSTGSASRPSTCCAF